MVDDFCRYSWWIFEIFGIPSYEFYLAGVFFELHQDDPNQDSNQQLTVRWSSVDVQIHKIHWNAMGCTILTTEFKYERPQKKNVCWVSPRKITPSVGCLPPQQKDRWWKAKENMSKCREIRWPKVWEWNTATSFWFSKEDSRLKIPQMHKGLNDYPIKPWHDGS